VVWRLRVDPVTCDRFGHCAELLPELIWVDEWGFPVPDDAPVPAHLLDLAEEAERACPRRALLLSDQPRRDPAAATDPAALPAARASVSRRR
jgi:ferredoxin